MVNTYEDETCCSDIEPGFIGNQHPAKTGCQSFSVVHNFTGMPDGAFPTSLLLNGNTLIGTTGSGGTAGSGCIFTCSTNGTGFTLLYNFTNTPDGSRPNEVLLNGSTLYGMTKQGGSNGLGAAFKLNINGTGYSQLHAFNSLPEGYSPLEGFTTDGPMLYGTTSQGGSGASGTVFRMDTNGGGFTVLHSFTNSPDGANPHAGLTLLGTNLFGTTFNGGLYNQGTIFRLTTNGTSYSVIYNFSNAPAARLPSASLLVISNLIYGTSSQGGSADSGTVFRLAPDGSGFTILHNFAGPTTPASNSDGGSPAAGLFFSEGLLYGDTTIGGSGSGSAGTIFQMSTNGTGFKVLKNFNQSTDGAFTQSGVVFGGHNLFGTGYFGGSGGSGTLFNLLFSPTITTNPQSLTVSSGNAASFTVVAADEGSLSYQWYFNTNTLLGGQTGSTLNLGSVGPGNAGAYTVSVTDSFGSITSAPAVLTVSSGLVKPSISVQPQPQTVTNGNAANFSVTAAGSTPLFYQWYFNSNTGNPSLLGSGLGGQTGSTLTFAVASGDGGYYSVIVTNAAGAVTSTPALLTVAAAATPPAISVQPQPQNVTNGFTANFSVSATGTATLAYQWYFNANTGNPALLGTGLGGQVNSTLSFTAASNNAGYYSVIVSNIAGAVTSSPALLTVIPANLLTLPGITAQPQSLNVTNGNSATFSVTATNALTYQWYFNTNNLLAGQTNNSFTINPASAVNAGAYTVAVANDNGAVTSSPAILTVYTNTKPVIIQQPQSVFVTSNDTAIFVVNAVGQGPLRYQWYFNTTSNSIGSALAGQTNSSRSFTASSGNGNYYSVVITNALGKATSSPPALLTIVMAPLIRTNPQAITINAGSTAAFAVSALGVSLHYQWYSNSIATALGSLLAGQTNSTFSFASAVNANGSYYSVLVTNTLGRATSSPALLTVTSAPSISITLQPTDKTITNGDPVSFTSAATGSGTLTYQWFFQTNVLIAGATSTTLSIATANQPGTYSMKAISGSGSVTSSPARLTVVGKPIMMSANFDATSGSYNFSYVNLAGSANRLWASTNLADPSAWSAIATFVMPTNTLWFGSDPNTAQTHKARFYRFSTP